MKIVVVGGPSGVGKNTVVNELVKKYPDKYLRFVGHASRPMRPGESQGDPYYFISTAEFEDKLKSGEIFEHTTMHGDYRGMSKSIINEGMQTGKVLIKDMDYIGALALKSIYGSEVISFFITIDQEEAAQRARNRGETEDYIRMRMDNFAKELHSARHFDHTVQNCVLDDCVEEIHRMVSGN